MTNYSAKELQFLHSLMYVLFRVYFFIYAYPQHEELIKFL